MKATASINVWKGCEIMREKKEFYDKEILLIDIVKGSITSFYSDLGSRYSYENMIRPKILQ